MGLSVRYYRTTVVCCGAAEAIRASQLIAVTTVAPTVVLRVMPADWKRSEGVRLRAGTRTLSSGCASNPRCRCTTCRHCDRVPHRHTQVCASGGYAPDPAFAPYLAYTAIALCGCRQRPLVAQQCIVKRKAMSVRMVAIYVEHMRSCGQLPRSPCPGVTGRPQPHGKALGHARTCLLARDCAPHRNTCCVPLPVWACVVRAPFALHCVLGLLCPPILHFTQPHTL